MADLRQWGGSAAAALCGWLGRNAAVWAERAGLIERLDGG
jgi:hypothetical protein